MVARRRRTDRSNARVTPQMRTIGDAPIIRLSMEDQRRMMDAIENPPEPTEGLQRAFEAHRRLIGKS